MSYDIDMCDGITYDNQICHLSQNCKRFMEKPDKGFAWFLDYAPYENGKCELQIRINDEKETEKNG